MKKYLLIVLGVCVINSACKKSSTNNETHELGYQVTASNSSTIDITYISAAGTTVTLSAVNSWNFDSTITQKPFQASIQASSHSPFSSLTTTCNVNILIDGKVVKTGTASSNTIAVASADYLFQ